MNSSSTPALSELLTREISEISAVIRSIRCSGRRLMIWPATFGPSEIIRTAIL